jgi:hypothetical protein
MSLALMKGIPKLTQELIEGHCCSPDSHPSAGTPVHQLSAGKNMSLELMIGIPKLKQELIEGRCRSPDSHPPAGA